MSGSADGFIPDVVVNVVGDRVPELPLPPAAPPKPTPRQRARTVAAAPEPPPPPPEPAPPGPELEIELGVSKQPRGGISINGTRADHLLVEMDVTNNRYFTADSFRCVLALDERDPNFGRAFWQDTDQMAVEFFVGFGVDEPPSKSLLAGRVDDVAIDLADRTVSLTGRDHTADLIETRLAEKWPNKTSSEIIRILAGMVNPPLEVDAVETEKRAGVYYGAEHAQLADETTAWNLATFLAEREGFDVYVTGRTIVFKPPPDASSAPRWTLRYQSGEPDARSPTAPVIGLSLSKSLTISRDINVRVVSWNSSKKHSIEGKSKSAKPGRGASGQFNSSMTYVFRIAGLTQDQADAEAKRRAEGITKNLRSFDANLPGHPDLDIRTIVAITGTGGGFDLDYHLDEIERRVSQGSGFSMRLRGRNIIPDDTAAL